MQIVWQFIERIFVHPNPPVRANAPHLDCKEDSVTLKSHRRSARSVTLLLAGIALSGPVTLFAGMPADTLPAVHVSFAELDLNTEAGVAILYQRLQGAARTVCGSVDARQLAQQARWTACYKKALADAVTQVDRPQLTALHRTRRHSSTPG
jgi:UrcA family protein